MRSNITAAPGRAVYPGRKGKVKRMIKDTAISRRGFDELEALAYFIADMNYLKERYSREESSIEREETHKNILMVFAALDHEGVPFWLQNAVIASCEDWRTYKSKYFKQIIEEIADRCKVRIEVMS